MPFSRMRPRLAWEAQLRSSPCRQSRPRSNRRKPPFRLRPHLSRHRAQEVISAPRCRPASPISAGIRSASSASVRNIVRQP